MGNSYFPERPIPLAEQIAVMKRHFPDFQEEWHKNIVQWVGELQPGGNQPALPGQDYSPVA